MQDLIPDRPLSKQEKVWIERYNELAKSYADGYVAIGANNTLGFWVRSQRKRKQHGSLSPWQERMLNNIGFKWSSHLHQEREKNWLVNLEKAKGTLLKEGKPDDWTKKQLYKLAKHQLKEWQSDLISALELDHTAHIDLRNQLWDSNFNATKLFQEEHKHLPHSKFPGAEKLGTWLESQRRMARKGSLSKTRLAQLRGLGFTFERVGQKDRVAKWMLFFEQLKSFYNEHGVSPVPRSPEMIKLSRWTDRQRRDRDSLLKKQIQLLDSISYPWDTGYKEKTRKTWLLKYRELQTFKSKNGHTRVPSKSKTQPKLGRWVEVQRLNQSKLEDWKRLKLEEIGFEWSSDIAKRKKERWYTMYDRLLDFVRAHGHAMVPEDWSEDVELSMWVIGQRRPKKPLSPERKRLLSDLGFVWKPREISRKRNDDGTYLSWEKQYN